MRSWKKFLQILLTVIIVIFTFFMLITIFLILSYNVWKNDFEERIPSQEVVNSVNVKIIKDITERIEAIVHSKEYTIVLELTPREVSYLVLDSFQNSNAVSLSSVYIQPIENGRWDVYLKIEILNKVDIWIECKVRKEDRETAEVFCEDILVGNYSLRNFGLKSLVDKINTALSSALITAEENGFTGRTFKNIELTNTNMMIKLERY